MKYKQKYLNDLYKHPLKNFTEIINISVYFDDINELDYGSEAVAAIESLDAITIAKLLISDLDNRKKSDFNNYGYQAIWWGLLNSKNNEVYEYLANNMTSNLKILFLYWLDNELETDDEPYIAIKKIFNDFIK